MNKDETIFIELNAVFWKAGHFPLSKDDMNDLAEAVHDVLIKYGYSSEMQFTLKDNKVVQVSPVNRPEWKIKSNE